MLIDRIAQISIPVTDQDRALAFYTEKLGFRLVGDTPMGGDANERWIEVEIPGAQTRLVLYGTAEQRDQIGSFSPIMFSSPDIEHTARELVARDIELAQPLTTEFWGTFLIFKDPDGNRFLVSGSPSSGVQG